MRASQRYAKVSEFRTVASQVYWFNGDTENHAIEVQHLVADMQDVVNHNVYQEGMHKVTATHLLSQKSWKRAKTFYGELAWSNATRLYDDYCMELARGDERW
jgi:hypothetical protein